MSHLNFSPEGQTGICNFVLLRRRSTSTTTITSSRYLLTFIWHLLSVSFGLGIGLSSFMCWAIVSSHPLEQLGDWRARDLSKVTWLECGVRKGTPDSLSCALCLVCLIERALIILSSQAKSPFTSVCSSHLFWTVRPDSYFAEFEEALAWPGGSKASNVNNSVRVFAS